MGSVVMTRRGRASDGIAAMRLGVDQMQAGGGETAIELSRRQGAHALEMRAAVCLAQNTRG